MAQFYFAWVDAGDDTFIGAYEREDENIFSFTLTHSEGQFPALQIDVINPRVGLLSTGRKKWCWLAYDDGATATVPLFFGRLIGIPQQMQANLVRLNFIARPSDWDAQKRALAETLKVRPHYDPVWISPERLDDPDSVLEGYSKLWHIDRVTHQVTVSDIMTGEDGTEAYGSNVYYDTLNVTYSQPPGRRIRCEAEVAWDQEAAGLIDISQSLVDAFSVAGTEEPFCVSTYTGQGLIEDWPEDGDRIGSGWEVGPVTLTRVDGTVYEPQTASVIQANGTLAEFPLWRIVPQMQVRYEAKRSRSEKMIFELEADVQAMVTEAGDDEVLYLTLSSKAIAEPLDAADSDNPDGALPIGDRARRSYFLTDRGRQSLEHLFCVARARLLDRARAVTVEFDMPFADGIALNCRKSATVSDDRLPGGSATGKIVSYELRANGDTGDLNCSVAIMCAVGNGNTTSPSIGTPDYVATGYVDEGWQTYSGAYVEVLSGELTYLDFSSTEPNDDGLNLLQFDEAQAVQQVQVINGPAAQAAVLALGWEDVAASIEALNAVPTEIDLTMVPLKTGPFETTFTITPSLLMVPKQIDLEAT